MWKAKFVIACMIAGLAAIASASKALADGGYDLGEAKHLKILYAGVPELERGKAFLAFLRENFAKVDAIGIEELDVKKAAPYDVVVADWKRLYGPGGIQETNRIDSPKLALGVDFGKPIVMLASVGGSIQHHTKIGWL
jgi:hypothetical protein